MKILAIDTSNQPMNIALVEDEQLLAQTTLKMVKNHSVYVLPVMDTLMQQVQWTPQDLDRVVVAAGPGSYTGIRIAVTTAKTLAATLKIDLVVVSSLAVLARNVPALTDAMVVPFFDARRGTAFVGRYQWQGDQLTALVADHHVEMAQEIATLGELGHPVWLVGEVTPKLAPVLADLPANVHLLGAAWATPNPYQVALAGQGEAPVNDIDAVVPRYLRQTEAEMNWYHDHPEADPLASDYVKKV